MNVLLIGGTGFIGKALTDFFLQLPDNYVVTVSRSSIHPLHNNHVHYNVKDTEWRTIIPFLQSFKNWIIIDLAYASIPNSSFSDPVKDFSENLFLINEHLRLAQEIQIGKYIYVSSGGTVYGNNNNPLITEDQPNFPQSPYGITKLACERYVYMHHSIYNLNINILRPSNLYGPGQAAFKGQGFIANAFVNALHRKKIQIFGDGRQVRDYLYIGDFCTAILQVIRHGGNGEIYNIGSGSGLSLLEIILAVNRVVNPEGYTLEADFLPARSFDVQANILHTAKLRAVSGWKRETMIIDGLQQTWNWIKKTYPVKTE